MRQVIIVTCVLVLSLSMNSTGLVTGQGGGRPPSPQPATAAVLEAFRRTPIVAIGEAHGLQQQHEFLQALLREPEFASSVGVVVVEFGNSLHQDVLDRYVRGEPVPPDELRQVWRNTTVSPMVPWDAPMYEQFFSVVRTVNQSLPPERQIQVLAGDPPIDWTLASREDVLRWSLSRDVHLASVVMSHALDRGRKALLVAGTLHVTRQSPALPGLPSPANAVQLIEQRYPGSTYVIAAHTGFGRREYELAPKLAGWNVPSIASLERTWFGALDAALFLGDNNLIAPPGAPAPPDPWSGLTLADVVDAALYLGNADRLTLAVPSPALYRDDQYFSELNRRSVLRNGRPLVLGPQFYRFGPASAPILILPPR